MISNKEIKRKELFKLTQQKIKLLGEVKNSQALMIYAINECALAELYDYNVLKRRVVELNMKDAVKRYTKLYMRLKCLENDIIELQNWNVNDGE